MPSSILRVMAKLTNPIGAITSRVTALPNATRSRTRRRVVPPGPSRSANVHWNCQRAPSSRRAGRPTDGSPTCIARTSPGRTSTTYHPPLPFASAKTRSPTWRSCHSGTIRSALWMPSPNRFSSQS